MNYTLLLIYAIGLGNHAISTEKFNTLDSCRSVGTQIVSKSDVIYASCTGQYNSFQDVKVEEIKTNR